MDFKKIDEDLILQGFIYEFEDEMYKGSLLIPFDKENPTIPITFISVESKVDLLMQPQLKFVGGKLMFSFNSFYLPSDKVSDFIDIVDKCSGSVKAIEDYIRKLL